MTKSEQPVVIVAALTYKRPEMLAQLLEALTTLERPAGWDVRFLIIDNDADGSARPVVERFATRFGAGGITYVIEAEPGIPAARNRALDEATARVARLLAFIDDDEYPDLYWLRELVTHFEKTRAVLIGGPVRSHLPDYATTPWQKFLARSFVGRNNAMERRAARRSRNGKPNVVATNNWLGDVVWLRAHALRFDHDLSVSGGEDAAYFYAVQSRLGRISWCETAVVYEHMASDRLSLRYHLSRAFAQGVVMARLCPWSTSRVCIYQSVRMLTGAGLIVIPLLGISSFAAGTRMVGNSVGCFSGMIGARSRLYARK